MVLPGVTINAVMAWQHGFYGYSITHLNAPAFGGAITDGGNNTQWLMAGYRRHGCT